MSWEIAEQIVHENATGLRLEFDAGQPGDNIRTLRIFTKERTRVVVLMFQAGGGLIKSDVRGVRDGQLEDVGQAAFAELHQDPAVADAAARSSADLTAHMGEQGVPARPDPGGVPGDPNTYAGEPTADPSEMPALDPLPIIGSNRRQPRLSESQLPDEPLKTADQTPKQQGVFYGE